MEEVAADTQFAERVRKEMCRVFALTDEIKSIEFIPLNRRSEVRVWRVTVTDLQGNSFCAVAKQLIIPGELDFIAEHANYIFLHSQQEKFNLFPKFLFGETDLLLIEDLGIENFRFESEEQILDSIAVTFAHLHVALAGLENEYKNVRATLNLPAAQDELRNNSESGRRKAANCGAALLADYMALMGICKTADFFTAIQPCFDLIFDKHSLLRTFVHDDVADRRQTVIKNGKIHLIDFEHGKYHHALMDLAKLMIGKVEHDSLRHGMFYNHPNITSDMLTHYRKHRLAFGAQDLKEEEWKKHLAAAMIMQVFLVIGKVIDLEGHQFIKPISIIIRDLLVRLKNQMQNNFAFPELMELFRLLEIRIIV
jgi:hypothetical protein